MSSQPRSEADLDTRIQKANYALRCTENFDCYSWAATLPRLPSTSVRIQELAKLAESCKIEAQIYGRRILDALIWDETFQDHLVHQLIGVIHELEIVQMHTPANGRCRIGIPSRGAQRVYIKLPGEVLA